MCHVRRLVERTTCEKRLRLQLHRLRIQRRRPGLLWLVNCFGRVPPFRFACCQAFAAEPKAKASQSRLDS